jgi:hypothetical protein
MPNVPAEFSASELQELKAFVNTAIKSKKERVPMELSEEEQAEIQKIADLPLDYWIDIVRSEGDDDTKWE